MNNEGKLKLAFSSAVISGMFCTVVALLLLLNYFQLSQSDPIESKALEALVERLSEDPGNEALKTEIRQFDLLARKAYFNSQWQIKTGAYLLLFGAIVLAVSLRFFYALKAKIEPPEKVPGNEIASRIMAQKGILITGAVVFVWALIASWATVNYLGRYEVGGTADTDALPAGDEAIEVIEVARDPVLAAEDTAGEKSGTPGEHAAVLPPAATGGEDAEASPEKEAGKSMAETPGEAEEATRKSGGQSETAESSPAGETTLTAGQLKKHHNSFRGPWGQGVLYHQNIPVEWDGPAGTNILWKTPVPKHGYNSPVVWGEKVFLSGADETSREVYCFNRSTGELLWTGKADGIEGSPSTPPRVTEDTGLAAPTVTTDGKRVFAIFGTGDVVAFDMEGTRVWAKNLGVPDNHYGHSSSLLTWDNKLFIQYDTNKSGKVMALDVTSGEKVWETNREANISWASPVLAKVNGKYQLILTSAPIIAGYDIKTGEELWTVDCMMGEVGPSVGYSGGIVFAANEYATLAAINIETRKILWEDNYYLPEASSPLAHEGLLFVCTSYGVMACYDALSGEMYWEHDVGTTLYASPVTAEGKVFMLDNEGVMRIYDLSKEMNLIAENQLGETSGTTPAFAEGGIYIRGEENLYCIGK